ncbi:MAG TPA: c-type cytochrome [Acidimicrobiales bacterium]|nr:c-type cytochrome [Acidimicrobiales bacterium]
MRSKLRVVYLLPALVVAGAIAGGLLSSGAAAHTTKPSPSTSSKSATVADPRGSVDYRSLPSSYVAPGEALFESTCASCHGTDALGSAVGPPLQGLGPATIDFWVSTGRMPLADPAKEPIEKPARFDRTQTLEIAAFVSSLAPTSPAFPSGVPSVDTANANLPEGNSLFVLNCAGCHTITGAGDALANGASAPSLHKATSTQVAEAIRTGPGNMPHFGLGNLSNSQVADIVAYVTKVIQHPNNRGGVFLGGIGPVAEGFVGLLIGVGGLMLVAYWIGDRA